MNRKVAIAGVIILSIGVFLFIVGSVGVSNTEKNMWAYAFGGDTDEYYARIQSYSAIGGSEK